MSPTYPAISLTVAVLTVLVAPSLMGSRSPAIAPSQATVEPYAPGQILVKFRSETEEGDRAPVRSIVGATLADTFRIGTELWRLPSSITVAEALRELVDREEILYAEPNYYIVLHDDPNDYYYQVLKEQWAHNNDGSKFFGVQCTPDADIDTDLAWLIENGDPNVLIAVTDSDAYHDHEDLVNNRWVNAAEQNGMPGVDDDGCGYDGDV